MSVSKIALFVTGTDTEIGKTLVSSALLYAFVQAGLRVAAMKPVAAGVTLHNGVRVNEDIELLRAQANIELPEHEMTPYLWDEPIAPHIAAQKRGVVMRAEVIRQAYLAAAQRADAIIVEGVGGFCVPLSCIPRFNEPSAKLAAGYLDISCLQVG